MKAKQYREAIRSFETALEAMVWIHRICVSIISIFYRQHRWLRPTCLAAALRSSSSSDRATKNCSKTIAHFLLTTEPLGETLGSRRCASFIARNSASNSPCFVAGLLSKRTCKIQASSVKSGDRLQPRSSSGFHFISGVASASLCAFDSFVLLLRFLRLI